MRISEYKTVKERKQFLEKKLSVSLASIEKATVDADEFVHCENRIGSISLPLGIAGPLVIAGGAAKGEYFIPLATTEGALVASVNRGAKACFEKGIVSSVERVGVTRGPVLKVGSIGEAKKTEQWIRENRPVLEREASYKAHQYRSKNSWYVYVHALFF